MTQTPLLRNAYYTVRCVLALMLLSAAASAQYAYTDPYGITGDPSAATFERPANIDEISVSNLNIRLHIPILHKPGRGIPFDLALEYNSQIWEVGGGSGGMDFVPYLANDYGWNDMTIGYLGQVSYRHTNTASLGCPPNTTYLQDFHYVDQNNTHYNFYGAVSSAKCSNDGGWAQVGHATFNDIGKGGHTLTVDSNGNVLSLYDRAGSNIVVPSVAYLGDDGYGSCQDWSYCPPPPPYTNGVRSITDRNGNTISANGDGTYTDTLGMTVLRIEKGTIDSQTTYTKYIYKGPQGEDETVTLYRKLYTVATRFQIAGHGEYPPTNAFLPYQLVYPDQTSYTFKYEQTPGYPLDVTARIAEIDLPTGGFIKYSYTDTLGSTFGGVEYPYSVTRTTNDGARTYAWGNGLTDVGFHLTVTDPQGNVTKYNIFDKFQAVTSESIYDGPASGTPRKTTVYCYSNSSTPCSTETGWNYAFEGPPYFWVIGAITIMTHYDSGPVETNIVKYGNAMLPTEIDDYDNGTATVLRNKSITYASLGHNILDRPSVIVITDGSSTQSKTTFPVYDDYGNAREIDHWIDASHAASELFTYTTGGRVASHTDSANNVTTFSYDNCNGSFTTLVSKPLSLSESAVWNCYGGVVSSISDENQQATNYTYDSMWRRTSVSYADGGSITTRYNATDTPPNIVQMVLIWPSNPSLTKTTQTNFDSLGRATRRILSSDPENPVYTETAYDSLGRIATVYNATRCYPPTSPCGESTWGKTLYDYDVLGRTKNISEADGSHTQTIHSGNCFTVTDEAGKSRMSCKDGLGRLTKVFEDPNGANWETDYVYNALGDLRSVTQKGGGSSSTWRNRGFQYDWLSRLISSSNPESGDVSYSYVTAAGSTCSGNTGSVCRRQAPSPNQPVNGADQVTTTYTYDSLGRLTSKSYSDAHSSNPATPSVTYGYDGTNLTCPARIGLVGSDATNGLGRRTAMCYSGGSKSWAYDAVGRVATENSRFTGLVPPYASDVMILPPIAVSRNTSYSYYLNGDLQSLRYPNGIPNYQFTTQENAAGRVVTAGDIYNNVLTSATYTPDGQLATACVGGNDCNSITISNTYNKRLQPIRLSASAVGGASILDLTYNFNLGNGTSGTDNGNVIQVTNGKDNSRTQNYIYDSLNRIQQAYTNGSGPSSWGETYSPNASAPGVPPSTPGIDAWGNLTNRSAVTGKTNYEPLNCPANTKNQLNACYVYDAAGNIIQNGSSTYFYDAENRLIAAGGMSYVYDGDGNRIKKCTEATDGQGTPQPGVCTSNAVGTFYWLHARGGTLGETDLGGKWTAAYGLIHGMIASRVDLPANAIRYYFHDHLGTADIVTDGIGNVLKESDYYPYGGEISIISNDSNRYKFTGKERDVESGLDNFGARYFGPSFGRFQTPDPVFISMTRVMDPQTLNLYAYGRNNPLSYVDPSGKDIVSGTGNQKAVKSALVELARHSGGREMLTKLDKLTQKITLSTGTGIKYPDTGLPAPAHHVFDGGIKDFQRTTDKNGKIVDVTRPNVEVTMDPALSEQMRGTGDPNAPKSDAELLGHELKEIEHTDFKVSGTEDSTNAEVDSVLDSSKDMSKNDAERFVDDLVKPNSTPPKQEPPKQPQVEQKPKEQLSCKVEVGQCNN